jgi:hypothetical protein
MTTAEKETEKKVWIEILVASPPTARCKAMIAFFESFLSEFPGKIRLDIYYAGEPRYCTPSQGFQKETGKIRRIPSGYVNGRNVASKDLPDRDKILAIIINEIASE